MKHPILRVVLLLVASLLVANGVRGQAYIHAASSYGLGNIPPAIAPLGIGFAFEDLDGDGDCDLFCPQSSGLQILLYRNDNGTFVDVTAGSGLPVMNGVAKGVATGDFDNDGDQDIAMGSLFETTRLFVNQGGLTFTEEGTLRGITNQGDAYGLCWGDYDRDGDLDLYVGNRLDPTAASACNVLYRNDNGYFTDVTAAAGVGDIGLALASSFMDYDLDGWPDIYNANDKGPAVGPNTLYHNNRDGTFTEIAGNRNAQFFIDAMGLDYVDAFNDGGVDMIITDHPTMHVFAVQNPTTLDWTNEAVTYGIGNHVSTGWAAHFVDYNNDAWQDMSVIVAVGPISLYRNPGPSGGVWSNYAGIEGITAGPLTYASATADLDNDGDMELIQRYQYGPVPTVAGLGVYDNTLTGTNWLKLNLEGTVSNRDGYGAHVYVTAGGITQRQQKRSGVGFLGHADSRLHFGLGAATTVDQLMIHWPRGTRQVLYNVPGNQILHVKEPAFDWSGSWTTGTTTLSLSSLQESGLTGVIALSLATTPGISINEGRVIPLAIDPLFTYSISPGNPLLGSPIGTLDPGGIMATSLSVPINQGLTGLPFFASGITYDPLHGIGTSFEMALPLIVP